MKASTVVPQVFYDLIARIVPGLVLVGCSFFVYRGPAESLHGVTALFGQKGQVIEIQFYLVLAILILSYAVAHLVSGVWFLWLRIAKGANIFRLKANDDWLSLICEGPVNDAQRIVTCLGFGGDRGIPALPSVAFTYDFVRLRSPDVGARLVKVRAECHMCAVLVTGLIVIAIWNLCKIIMSPAEGSFCVELALVVSILAFWFSMRELEERFITGLYNYWFLLLSPACNRSSEVDGQVNLVGPAPTVSP